ncbi:MAG: LacI family transcriptional regulator [Oscillospiraceae bacterium]|jgi:LacI family transcriptional regulator|nr:LacI family transcriptional regulator [Oscillospiraceae bacterium]
MVTLKDIAVKAGVSKTTVSNVLNGNLAKVSPCKAKLIQELIAEYGYVPNQTARSLSNKSSRIISLIVYADRDKNVLSDPYIALFAGELLRQLQKRGYFGMIRATNEYADILQNLNAWNAQGVIFFGTLDKDIREMQDRTGIPFVFTDSYSSVRRINNVGIDDYRGGMIAAEHLAQRGHRRLALFAPGLESGSDLDKQRIAGFRHALGRYGASLPEDHVMLADPCRADEMARSLASLPGVTGAFVTADIAAIELMRALKRLGISVPKDISIVGFDDIPLARLVTPGLTTIRQDITQKARVAAEILERRLDDPSRPNESAILDVTLVQRESVGWVQS